MKLVAVAVIGAAACAASAQTMTYFWTVTTDDGDTDVTPGERAYLSLWAHMEPEVVGFAGSIYDIVGVSNWSTGEIELYDNLLDSIYFSEPDGENNIYTIEAFQLPPLFNPDFDAGNPIELYRIWWSTDDYTPRVVEVGDTNHLNNDVYTDEFGMSMAYEGIPGVARFTVAIPAPGALMLLGAGGLGAARRRRS